MRLSVSWQSSSIDMESSRYDGSESSEGRVQSVNGLADVDAYPRGQKQVLIGFGLESIEDGED